MKDNRECLIVQDLLPSYVDKLTNEETDKWIEEHLDGCEECSDILENMKADKDNWIGKNREEAKYMKKINNKIIILKSVILIIVLCILILLLGKIANKFMILHDISNLYSQNNYKDNFHVMEYYYREGSITKLEYFRLGNKYKFSSTMETYDGKITQTTYSVKIADNEYIGTTYVEKNDSKSIRLNDSFYREVPMENVLYSRNFGDMLKNACRFGIETIEYKGKKCYEILNVPVYTGGMYNKVYVDKGTGLIVATVQLDDEQEYTMPIETIFEYGNVSEKEFEEPDMAEYEVLE